jgi:Flp pilus assembly secretin CpaC
MFHCLICLAKSLKYSLCLDITIFLSTNVIYIILGKNSRSNKNQQMALIICFGVITKNVGLTLKVKPQINEGSGVKLKIEQEVSNVVPSASAVDMITSKRKIKTTVMVDNNKILDW